MNRDEILVRFRFLHGFRYQYDLTDYEDITSKIAIVCPKHGYFVQSAAIHSRGGGCLKCTREKIPNEFRLSNDLILDRFQKVHGDRYDYSLVQSENCKSDVTILCPDHGSFSQKVKHHASGDGCLKCGETSEDFEMGGDRLFYKILFTHKLTGIKFIKVGITFSIVESYGSPAYEDFEFEVLDFIKCSDREGADLGHSYKISNERFYIPKHIRFPNRTECYEYEGVQELKQKGMSFIREYLLEKQGGICPICTRVVTNPVVDHHHKKRVKGSGLVRGVLCSACNTFIARLENNFRRHLIPEELFPTAVRKMADYFEFKRTNLIHPSEVPKVKKVGKRTFNRIAKLYKKDNPKKKELEYPKSGKPTKQIKELSEFYNVIIN